MEYDAFSKSITAAEPPQDLNQYALSLWWDAKGDWQQAHTIIQDMEDINAAWIHAYLHRKEGDTGNAGYWYNRAGKKMPQSTLQEEWKEILQSVL
ncbi:MAG: hypothetical protein ABIU63_01650 [Chitinophagaceae bacterium]